MYFMWPNGSREEATEIENEKVFVDHLLFIQMFGCQLALKDCRITQDPSPVSDSDPTSLAYSFFFFFYAEILCVQLVVPCLYEK